MFAFHKRDKNEKLIIAALVAIGARVCKIQGLPGGDGDFGVPDLLVGYRGRTILLEVKDPETHQHTKKGKGGTDVPENAKGQLTPTQVEWWSKWTGGEAYVVETPEQAVALVRGADLPANVRIFVDNDEEGHAVTLGWDGVIEAPPMITPAEADVMAGALHEQAAVARAMAAADKRDTKPKQTRRTTT